MSHITYGSHLQGDKLRHHAQWSKKMGCTTAGTPHSQHGKLALHYAQIASSALAIHKAKNVQPGRERLHS